MIRQPDSISLPRAVIWIGITIGFTLGQLQLFLTQENVAKKIRNFRGYYTPATWGFMNQHRGRSKEKW